MASAFGLLRAPLTLTSLGLQLKRQEGGRQATHYLKRLGLSQAKATDATRFLKIAASPLQYAKRRNVAKYLRRTDVLKVPRDTHFMPLPENYLHGVDTVVAHCAGLYEAKKEQMEYTSPYGMLIRCLHNGTNVVLESSEEVRPILEFCSQPKLFGSIAQYMDAFPVLSSISLVYTKPNSDTRGSQKFHRDMNERKQLHLVMPIWSVQDENGPFTLVPGNLTDKIIATIGDVGGRIEDEEILKVVKESDFVKLTGQPGTAYLANPYRCLHFGARARSKPRLLLIVNFTSPFEGAEGLDGVYRAANRYELDNGKPEVRWLLNI